MFRFIIYSLLFWVINAPIQLHAGSLGEGAIPEPPELSKDDRSAEELPTEPATSSAQPSVPPAAAPEPPDLPMPIKSGENLEPDITIIRKADKTIQEYRRGGVIYMVKVIPDKGPAYYLIDINGDGKLDIRGSDLDKGLSINQWKLLEWK